MKACQTRSERHTTKRPTIDFKLTRKSVAPVVGVGLALAPAAVALMPEQAHASELQDQNVDSVYGFINQIGSAASQVADANDLYASVMIAQALVESGNGSSTLSTAPYYNLFGVKGSYNGQSVSFPTQEYLNGQWVTMNEPFRQYNSYWEAFQDHAYVLRSTSMTSSAPYYAGAWKSNTSSYLDATAHLTGRYATDPGYQWKLNWLIQNYNLTQYDTPAAYTTTQTTSEVQTETVATTTGTGETAVQSPATTSTNSQTTSGQTYTVISGDTLWDIANKFGLSVDQLMANNGLTSDVIMIGQQLTI